MSPSERCEFDTTLFTAERIIRESKKVIKDLERIATETFARIAESQAILDAQRVVDGKMVWLQRSP